MGQRGPAPTPTKILEFRGSWLAKRRKGEPKPADSGAMRAPEWLTPEARIVWKKTLEKLRPLGLASSVDTNALARYCTMFVEWKITARTVQERGQTYVTQIDGIHPQTGEKIRLPIPRQRPEVRIMLAMSAELSRLEQQFGMTPSARASLGMELDKSARLLGHPQEEDEAAAYFND